MRLVKRYLSCGTLFGNVETKIFIDLVEHSEIIYLKNQQIYRGMYYVDVSPLKGNNKSHFT